MAVMLNGGLVLLSPDGLVATSANCCCGPCCQNLPDELVFSISPNCGGMPGDSWTFTRISSSSNGIDADIWAITAPVDESCPFTIGDYVWGADHEYLMDVNARIYCNTPGQPTCNLCWENVLIRRKPIGDYPTAGVCNNMATRDCVLGTPFPAACIELTSRYPLLAEYPDLPFGWKSEHDFPEENAATHCGGCISYDGGTADVFITE